MILDYKQFPSGKQYACIRDGGKQIFLRNIAFLHAPGDASKIVLVHEWGYPTAGEWEPPKGQMEWKEFAAAGFKKGQDITGSALIAAMRDGVLREVEEEAKIRAGDIEGLDVLQMSYSEDFPAAGKNAMFRYQFWTGVVAPAAMANAQAHIAEIVGNKKLQKSLPPDKKEKDAVAYWSPATDGWDKIRGAFSGTMTRMYYGRRMETGNKKGN